MRTETYLTQQIHRLYPFVFVVIFLTVGCDRDTAQAPQSQPEPIDYTIWFDDTNESFVHQVTARTGTQNSTLIPTGFNGTAIAASADGKRVFLGKHQRLAVFDADSGRITRQLDIDCRAGAIASPDGRLLAVLGGTGLSILDAESLQVLFASTDWTLLRGMFNAHSSKLYVSLSGPFDSSGVYVFAQTGSTWTRSIFPIGYGGTIFEVAVSVDERYAFLYFRYAFAIHDLVKDSLVYYQNLSQGAGDIAVSPDGSCVYFTNPGTMQSAFDSPLPSEFYRVALDNSFTLTTIPATGPCNVYGSGFVPGPITITPDSRTLIVTSLFPGQALFMDTKSESCVQFLFLEGVSYPACQSKQ